MAIFARCVPPRRRVLHRLLGSLSPASKAASDCWKKTVVLPNYIERFNNTLRQRVGRLVRRSLSFSKKLSNHLGAIWDLIHYYNAALTI